MADWVKDAANAVAPGETFCGLQVPEIRRGEQIAAQIDAAFVQAAFASNGALARAQEELQSAKKAVAGWATELGALRAEKSRLQNLVLTKSPENSEKDPHALRQSLEAATQLCEQASAGLEQAIAEERAIVAEIDRLVTAS